MYTFQTAIYSLEHDKLERTSVIWDAPTSQIELSKIIIYGKMQTNEHMLATKSPFTKIQLDSSMPVSTISAEIGETPASFVKFSGLGSINDSTANVEFDTTTQILKIKFSQNYHYRLVSPGQEEYVAFHLSPEVWAAFGTLQATIDNAAISYYKYLPFSTTSNSAKSSQASKTKAKKKGATT